MPQSAIRLCGGGENSAGFAPLSETPLSDTAVELERIRAEYARRSREIPAGFYARSEEHTSELQSRQYLVCRLLLEKKKTISTKIISLRIRYHVTLSRYIHASSFPCTIHLYLDC